MFSFLLLCLSFFLFLCSTDEHLNNEECINYTLGALFSAFLGLILI